MACEQALNALLLVDTCGECGSVALAVGDQVVQEVTLAERSASTHLLAAVREVLAAGHLSLQTLEAVGVVNGPGSFTGVRVGLAVAKGLCEAAGLAIAAVSRLDVLASVAGLEEGFAVLRAGRDQVYVRAVQAGVGQGERLLSLEALRERVRGQALVCAEQAMVPLLAGMSAEVRCVALGAGQALAPVRRCLAAGGSSLALVDANYVRDEEAIYARALQGS